MGAKSASASRCSGASSATATRLLTSAYWCWGMAAARLLLALQLLVFTPHVTLVAWDGQLELEDKQLQALQEHDITVYDCDCASFSCASVGMVTSVQLDTGEEIEFDMLFVAQRIAPSNELANQLNLMCDKNGFVVVDAEAATNVPGVFAAGDVTRLYNHQISSAVHEGGMAAAAANHYLYEDWQQE